MASGFNRVGIIGVQNTRFNNTTSPLNLNVNLLPAPGLGNINLVTATALSGNNTIPVSPIGGGLNNNADAATTANVGIRFNSLLGSQTAPAPFIRSSRGGTISVFGTTQVQAVAAQSINLNNSLNRTLGISEARANLLGDTGGIINQNSVINSDGPGGAPLVDGHISSETVMRRPSMQCSVAVVAAPPW